MKNKKVLYIKMAYVWGLIIFAITTTIDMHAAVRAGILTAAYVPITVVHIMVAIGTAAWRTRKPFFLLSMLWLIKSCLFVLNETYHLSTHNDGMFLEWIDMFLLSVIFVSVSVSFVRCNPFFYGESQQTKTVFVVGVLLSIACTLYTVTAVIMFLSFYHFFGLSLLK